MNETKPNPVCIIYPEKKHVKELNAIRIVGNSLKMVLIPA